MLGVSVALLASVAGASSVAAQAPTYGFAEDSGAVLNRHLKELADNPRSLSALLGAAKAALELGDPQAAVTFYARAEEVAPRDGRIKAGIGAAFLAMEQPEPALKFLDEARGLGLPEGAVAADRGLARDLLGDPVAAQRDYALAMRANDGDEVRRRLALSRAISGDRAGALSAIEDQVRRGSPAGRRVRAFVLALTGDPSGATEAARVAMPMQASALQPFFARLPSLRPAERAMAVHFGRFPGDGPPGQAPLTTPTYAALPPNVILGGRPDPSQPGLATRRPVTTAPITQPSSPGQNTRLAVRVDPVVRPPLASTAPPVSSIPRTSVPVVSTAARPSGPVQGPPDSGTRPVAVAALPATTSALPASTSPAPGISAIELPASAPASPDANPQPRGRPVSFSQAATAPAGTVPDSQPAPGMATPAPRPSGLASVAAAIRALDEPAAAAPDQQLALLASRPELPAPAAATPPPAQASQPPSQAAPEPSPVVLAKRTEIPSPTASTAPAAKPPPPRRFWVQLGGKPDEAGLTTEFQRLKGKAPELLGDKAAWTAPASASNSRLLVGPFKTRDDADLFVQLLDDEGLRATAWTSLSGQEVVKLAAK